MTARTGRTRSNGLTTKPEVDAPSAGAQVLMVVGAEHLSTHVVDRPLVIGRDRGCDVAIDDASLSRRHVRVSPGPRPTVQDLGSTNGTTVAGERRRGGPPVALAAGDSFRVGGLSFVLVSRGIVDGASMSFAGGLRVVDPAPGGVPPVVADLAISPVSVLILGETGVGKEVLATTIHALSGRTGPLARINCAALSETLLESELFGHEKGAFTGAVTLKRGLLESADRGAVFLDEIGEMTLAVQAKLLRAVEHREVLRLGSTKPLPIDVRFIAATNRDLPAEVDAGRFRRDLFFRLDGVTLTIPPLRERRTQIASLALGFLAKAWHGARAPQLSPEVIATLEAHDWPGNVRELKAVVERAVLLARGALPERRHFTIQPPAGPVVAPSRAAAADDTIDATERADRDRVLAALTACAGNQSRAARELGISRTTLVTKLLRYRIPRPRA